MGRPDLPVRECSPAIYVSFLWSSHTIISKLNSSRGKCLQDDCASFAMALLKSRDFEDEDDDTILARLSFKNSSVLAVRRLLKSEVFEQRRQSLLKGRTVGGEHDGERRKAIRRGRD